MDQLTAALDTAAAAKRRAANAGRTWADPREVLAALKATLPDPGELARFREYSRRLGKHEARPGQPCDYFIYSMYIHWRQSQRTTCSRGGRGGGGLAGRPHACCRRVQAPSARPLGAFAAPPCA